MVAGAFLVLGGAGVVGVVQYEALHLTGVLIVVWATWIGVAVLRRQPVPGVGARSADVDARPAGARSAAGVGRRTGRGG